jgi:hypothetical protein
MRKALLLVALIVIGGFFSGCTATRAWVQDTLKESIDTVKAESKGALDTVIANLMNSLRDQGKKLLADIPGIAKGAAQSLLDAEKKRKELQAREVVKINTELNKVVPDLSYDTNKDGKVTCEDFLDEKGDLSVASSIRLVMYFKAQPAKPGQTKDSNALLLAVGAMGLLGVGGAAGSYAQKKLNNSSAPPVEKA